MPDKRIRKDAPYHQYSQVSDVEMAKLFDEFVETQPPEIRGAMQCNVSNLRFNTRNIGEIGAKATVMRTYMDYVRMHDEILKLEARDAASDTLPQPLTNPV